MDAEQNYLLETIDRELTNISVSQLELTLDGDITYMINMDGVLSDYWHYRNISDMLDQLNQIARNNYWITQIRLHIPSMGKTLTSDLDPTAADGGMRPTGRAAKQRVHLLLHVGRALLHRFVQSSAQGRGTILYRYATAV